MQPPERLNRIILLESEGRCYGSAGQNARRVPPGVPVQVTAGSVL